MDWKFIILAALGTLYLVCDTNAQSEGAIHDAIFSNYNPQVRPTYNHSLPTYVGLNFLPFQLLEINEKDQTMSIYGALLQAWVDPFLTWDPSQYNGQKSIFVDSSKHWTPPLGIINSVSSFFNQESEVGFQNQIYYTGRVTRQSVGEYKVSCSMSVRKFPFDEHNCQLRVASATMDSNFLKPYPYFPNGALALDLYTKNVQWELTGTLVTATTISPTLTEGAGYDGVVINFSFKRKSTFHQLNIIAPLIMTTFIAPTVFLLPAEAGEKVGLGITVLLALSVFLLTLGDLTPVSSDNIPLLTEYVAFQMAITCLAIVCSVLVLRLHHCTSPKRPSPMTRRVFLGLVARVLCLGDLREKEEDIQEYIKSSRASPVDSISYLKDEIKKDVEFAKMSPSNAKLLQYMEILVKDKKEKEEAEKVADEWKTLGNVIDWLMFWIFTVILLIFTTYTFVQCNT